MLPVKLKIIIVEDQFTVANNLQTILEQAGYSVRALIRSTADALKTITREVPDIVLLDVNLQGKLNAIDLGKMLKERNIVFIYISADYNQETLHAAKLTRPYGFIVKPFKKEDVLVMIDVAWYLHRNSQNDRANGKALKASKVNINEGVLEGIIGNSKEMNGVLDKIKVISQSDTSVLICGESGTGKELIAQAIHKVSPRRDKSLVVVNCAALPANIIESELFGHEKGAFTGANTLRIGKFEQADGGTIFLDEIGELPLDLQVKFLRVLQEMEIERIGGSPKKIDVRVIAATNRNLETEIEKDNFRLDLFYRLNIFPIFLPALRARREDILPLAHFFIARYASKEGKTISGFTENVIRSIINYNWPGNVRELENLMARSVILATGEVINSLVLPKVKPRSPSAFEKDRVKTMVENERDHIVAVLEKCNGKIYGEGGAAELLDINVSTLNSRMRKLGIKKRPR